MGQRADFDQRRLEGGRRPQGGRRDRSKCRQGAGCWRSCTWVAVLPPAACHTEAVLPLAACYTEAVLPLAACHKAVLPLAAFRRLVHLLLKVGCLLIITLHAVIVSVTKHI